MINLTSNSELRMTLGTAVSVHAYTAFVDYTAPSTVAPNALSVLHSTTTPVAICASPSGSTIRNVKTTFVRNVSATNPVVVNLQVYNTAISLGVTVCERTLQPAETLVISDGVVQLLDATGQPVVRTVSASPLPDVLLPPHFTTGNLSSTKTLASGNTYAVYVGRAPRAMTSCNVRWRVTTAAATITWAELAVAKGPVVLASGPSLTVVGWADVSTPISSVGQKSTAINVSAGQVINEGDPLWVLIGNSAATAAIVRAPSIADDLQLGVQGYLATRPSTIVGTPTAFTIESASMVSAWVALVP